MQNTKQVLDWDKQSIFKRKREFYLDEDLVDKIDSIEYGAQVNKIEEIEVNWVPVEPDESKTVHLNIPRVIDALTSDSSTDALSARMWKYLYSLYQQTWTLYRYRWSVATFNDLPESWNLQWDVYNILETGMNYAWTGTEWDALWQIDRYDIFVTRTEYNALPSSKLTDWNTYFIVDSHINSPAYTWAELEAMWSESALQILNEYPEDYARYYASTWDLTEFDYYEWFNEEHWPLNPLPEWKYVLRYNWQYNNCSISIYVSNLTESEISSVWFPSGYHFDEWWELRCWGSSM